MKLSRIYRWFSKMFRALEYRAVVHEEGVCQGGHPRIPVYGVEDDFPRCAFCGKVTPKP